MGLSWLKSAPLSIGRGVQRAGVMAVNILFPPLCLGCGEMVSAHGGVCTRCWRNLRQFEKPWCDVMGTPFAHDMGEGSVGAEAIADPPPFERARSAVHYDDLARAMVHRLKYVDRTDLALVMAGWMARAGHELIGGSDRLVSVPLHRRRFLARRYNQSAELARALSRQTGLHYLPGALVRKKATRSQVGLGVEARIDNMRGVFAVPDAAKSLVLDRSLLLVDDVYTTGATVKSAARTLLRAGADRVSVLTFARVAPTHWQTLYKWTRRA